MMVKMYVEQLSEINKYMTNKCSVCELILFYIHYKKKKTSLTEVGSEPASDSVSLGLTGTLVRSANPGRRVIHYAIPPPC